MVRVDGTCDQAFKAVAEAFAANFELGEIGAACTVSIDGAVVVDIWGGWTDADRNRPWASDTLVNAYSVGKPIVALALLQQVALGRVDLDEPASRVWPELVAGQHGATVRHVLCHRAGVPTIRERLTNDDLWDWPTMCRSIAATDPWWAPGTPARISHRTPMAISSANSPGGSTAAFPVRGCARRSPARSALTSRGALILPSRRGALTSCGRSTWPVGSTGCSRLPTPRNGA